MSQEIKRWNLFEISILTILLWIFLPLLATHLWYEKKSTEIESYWRGYFNEMLEKHENIGKLYEGIISDLRNELSNQKGVQKQTWGVIPPGTNRNSRDSKHAA